MCHIQAKSLSLSWKFLQVTGKKSTRRSIYHALYIWDTVIDNESQNNIHVFLCIRICVQYANVYLCTWSDSIIILSFY